MGEADLLETKKGKSSSSLGGIFPLASEGMPELRTTPWPYCAHHSLELHTRVQCCVGRLNISVAQSQPTVPRVSPPTYIAGLLLPMLQISVIPLFRLK